MSIQEIAALEPRVDDLLAAARAEAQRGADPNALYARCKRLLEPLVGFCAADRRLCGAAEYETVLKALCDAVGL